MASRSDIVAGGAAVEITALDYTAGVFAKVENNLFRLGSAAMKVGAGMLASATAAAAGLAIFTAAAAASAAAVDDASQRTGVNVAALQEFVYAGGQSGATLEDLTKAFRALNLIMADDEGRKKLEALGLNLAALDKMSPEARLEAIAEAIKNLGDIEKQTAAANDIFGKSGFALLPFLSGGAVEIEKMREEARSLGQVLSGEAVSGLAKFDDTVAKLTGSLQGIAGIIAGQLAPVFDPIAKAVVTIAQSLGEWIAANTWLTAGALTSIGVVGALGAAFVAFGVAVVALGSVITALTAIFGAVSSVVAVVGAPFLLIAGAIAAVIAVIPLLAAGLLFLLTPFIDLESAGNSFGGVISYLTDVMQGFYLFAKEYFGPTVQGMADAFSNGNLAAAAEIAFLNVQIAATKALDVIIAYIERVIDSISLIGGAVNKLAGITDSLKEMNAANRDALRLDLELKINKQARIKVEAEAAAVLKAEAAARQAAIDAALAKAPPPPAVVAAAEAVKAAGVTAQQTTNFGNSGTQTSGAAAFLGANMTFFKPLEELQKQAVAALNQIQQNTADGMGVQIA
jgi:hypothetical protein